MRPARDPADIERVMLEAIRSAPGNEAYHHSYADLLDEWGRPGEADLLRRIGSHLRQVFVLKEDRFPKPAEAPHVLLAFDHPQGDPLSLSLLCISRTVEADYRLRLYLMAWLPRQEADLIFSKLWSEGGWRTTQRVLTMEDVRDAELGNGGPGFDSDNLRMFDSRLHELHHGPGGIFFVTAGFDATDTARSFRVREFHPCRVEAGSLISVVAGQGELASVEAALACLEERANRVTN